MPDEDTIVVAQPQHRKRFYHIWTHEQRVCVYLLSHEFHHLNITARAKVFNKIFETKLAACSIPLPGLKPMRIYHEYWKSKAPGMDARQPWKDVYFPPDTVEEDTMRGSMRARIAFILGGESTQVESSDILTAQSTPSEQHRTGMQTTEKRKRPATILVTPPSTTGEDDEDEDEDEFDIHFSPRKTNQRHRSPVAMSIQIDHTSLSVFYVPPYQQELARKHLFHGREHRYKGYSEHLVYNEVPGSAIVKTFSYQELVGFAQSDRIARKTPRLPELRCSGTSSTDILKIMKQNKLRITPQVAILIANFVMFLGVDSSASMSKIAFLVCEIVRGWALRNAETTTAEWQENVDRFMDTFYRKSDRVLSKEEQVKLECAFITGIRLSCLDIKSRTTLTADALKRLDAVAARHKMPHARQFAEEKLNVAMLAVSGYDTESQRTLQSGSPSAPQVHITASDGSDNEEIVFE